MSGDANWWRHAVSDGVPRRSFFVALVVGTILNLINQGDTLLSGGSTSWLKVILTYFVPYAVCTYGAISSRLAQPPAISAATQPENVVRNDGFR